MLLLPTHRLDPVRQLSARAAVGDVGDARDVLDGDVEARLGEARLDLVQTVVDRPDAMVEAATGREHSSRVVVGDAKTGCLWKALVRFDQ